jgi:acyl-CoA oxidase
MESFSTKWISQVDTIQTNVSYQDSAKQLQHLIRTGLLSYTDAKNDPSKFFNAHRLLVRLNSPGFCIRFTVQYNLFAGSILGMGGPEQLKSLDEIQKDGELGCFALTEKLAGVQSGLVVLTTCTWNIQKQCFILHSPSIGAVKNWISQGLTAQRAVVIADLIVQGKSYGPHGFLIEMRTKDGMLKHGISITDMGMKTTGNDLDNASIEFIHCEIPKNALLNRYGDIQNNSYIQLTKEKMRIEILGQRLLTGRLAIAQASLVFCRALLDRTQSYAKSKLCWSPGNDIKLASVPHLHDLFNESKKQLDFLDDFCNKVEVELSSYLKLDKIPTPHLINAISVAKICAVENAIRISFELKQEVGSYALMQGSGFEHADFLQCCKFAEGDSRILKQKLVRDYVRMVLTLGKSNPEGVKKLPVEEVKLCMELSKDWDQQFRKVYMLATMIELRTMKEWMGRKTSSKI